ncbi:MAG: N-acetyltransferase [Gammaproteobacteria bacterium]|nr:MAG: N-acetyltransferase [Gammaproteobacteria bacterium]
MIPEQLSAERLKLRPFTPADGKSVFDYWNSDADWARFNKSVPDEYSEVDAEKFVADLVLRDRESQPNWALVIDGRVSGVVSLTFEQGHRIAVIGYGIHGALRGQGLSGEAVKTVIDGAFRSYSMLQKIRAHTDSRNTGSIRVLEKLGFKREGILRSNQFVKGELTDEAIYGLLRKEWSD